MDQIQIHYTKLFINNEFVDGVKKQVIPIQNPVDETEICKIAEATEDDVELAVVAAEEAYTTTWSKVTQDRRNYLLNKLADLVEKHTEYLIKLESFNTGRPYYVCANDMHLTQQTFRFYAGASDKIFGKTVQNIGNCFCYTRKEPYGVVALISPWNFPLYMAAWKMAPALAAGNCVVLKPSEITPLTVLFLAHLVVEAGFPKGVINVVPGYGWVAGNHLSHHPRICKISFTGSTAVGRLIQKASSDTNLKKTSLELGGKSPLLIFADCNFERTVQDVFLSAFYNSAQSCIAGSRILVQDTIYDKFVEAYKARIEQTRLGSPEEKAELGPIINLLQFQRVLKHLEVAKEENLECVVGGGRQGTKGFFIQPTMFKNVKDTSRLAVEEIFGPVSIVLTPFKTVEEAIQRANDTIYGLSSAVFSENLNTVERCVRGIQAGTVFVNNYYGFYTQAVPFNGYKHSGFGSDNGLEAIDEYTRTKAVYHKFDL